MCRSYYGDHFGINNDNHYQLFSANGYDFVVLHIEYMSADTALRQAVVSWANAVLANHNDRRAIVVSHYVLTNSLNFSNQGSARYEGLIAGSSQKGLVSISGTRTPTKCFA